MMKTGSIVVVGILATAMGCAGPKAEGSGTPREGLAKPEVASVIDGQRDAFQRCYTEELGATPTLAGTLEVSFTIGTDGSVVAADVTKDGLGSAAVGSCVISVLKTLKFPAPADGTVTVGNSFVFQSDK